MEYGLSKGLSKDYGLSNGLGKGISKDYALCKGLSRIMVQVSVSVRV